VKTLLRSVFVADPGDNDELFLRNFLALQDSNLGFERAEDIVIWDFVREFVHTHNHVPNISTLNAHFRRKNEDEVVDRLQMLVAMPSKSRGDFLKRLEDKADDRRLHQWTEILKEAGTITSSGMKIELGRGKGEKILHGAIDAARYVVDKSHGIVAPTLGTRISGEVTSDGQTFKDRYERVESDPLAGIGQFTGLMQMDEALSGAKRAELWIHAAFTGGMKSTFALNWAYNQSVYFHHSSVFFSLEMPYVQVMNILYAMHTAHEKFKPVRHRLGIQKDPEATVGLNYLLIRDGLLPANQREFLFEHVIPDFNDPANHYGEIHVEVADPDKDDFTIVDLRTKAELIFSKAPFASIFVDHAGLMASRKWVSSTTERQNEVIRDLKKMAMGFHRGLGIAVIALFQMNREGYKRILKVKEINEAKEKDRPALFNETDLSYANEAEKSADIITATWIDDDLKDKNRVQFQNLKSRDQAKFSPFLARVEWPCRRIFTVVEDIEMLTRGELDEAVSEIVDEELDG
tara:strand:+ start:5701 stop:7254 length:1554 start_codon:yes stop_codon:yes gene_type:complete